jgi:hypothetical protein
MRIPFTLLGLLLLLRTASADVRIVPESRNAAQLRATQTDFDVKINPAARFARVTSTWVFANTSPRDFEAEFVVEAPYDAIVSQFSYWFRGKKTMARIVEKERAARIYAEATAPPRRRDPALVEMLARNFFRVRIAPVEANKPLKIEIVWLQPVKKDGDKWTITLPWREKSKGVVVEKYSLHASFSSPVESLSSSLEGSQADATSLHFLDGNGGALPESSNLTFSSKQAPVVLQNRASGPGFFMAIVSEAAWKTRAGWSGVDAIHSRTVGSDELLVAGRFRQASPATVLKMGSAIDADQAEKWWAALHLDVLAGDEKNRATGIALSKRFGMPSKWTSWLAIPDAERERLFAIINREKVEAAVNDMNRLGPSLAKWKAAGRTNSKEFRSMLKDFNRAHAIASRDSNRRVGSLDTYYSSAAYGLSRLAESNANSKKPSVQTIRKLQIQVNRLVNDKNDEYDVRARVAEQLKVVERRRIGESAFQAVLRGESTVKFERQIRRVFIVGDQGTDTASSLLEKVGTEYTRARMSSAPGDAAKAARLRSFMELLTRSVYRNDAGNRRAAIKSAISSGEYIVYGNRFYILKNGLEKEIEAKRETGKKYAELRREYDALLKKAPSLKNSQGLELDNAIQKTQIALWRAQSEEKVDTAKVAEYEAELKRLGNFVDTARFNYAVSSAEQNWRRERESFLAQQWWKVVERDGATSPRAEQLRNDLQKLLDASRGSMPEAPYWRAETKLKEVEGWALHQKSSGVLAQYNAERSAISPDPQKLVTLLSQLDALQNTTLFNKTGNDIAIKQTSSEVFEQILAHIRSESEKQNPNEAQLAQLKTRLVEVADADQYYGWGGWATGRRGTPQEHAKLRVERIGVRSKLQKANAKLAQSEQLPVAQRGALEKEVAELRQLDNQLRVRMGDPLIAVAAPKDARQVLALFPSGELKRLEWNPQTSRWEARFDVPTWANEGDYAVQIVVVFQNGAKQKLTMHFAVDMQAPSGSAQLHTNGKTWLLKLETDEHTDRVSAFLPWNERVELRRDVTGMFVAAATVPDTSQMAEANPASQVVRFVLTDKSHNKTEILIDWK